MRWEVINEEDEKKANTAGTVVKEEPLAHGVANNPDSTQHSVDVGKWNTFVADLKKLLIIVWVNVLSVVSVLL